jgi:alkylation response protein AidB-like acyl-CoA dehydrogenase
MEQKNSETGWEIRQLTQKIFAAEVTPTRQAQLDVAEYRFDEKLWQTLADAGLLGIAIPEEYGGMGLGFLELCALTEEVGRAVAAVPVVPVLAGAALAISEFGSASQKQRYLPEIAAGRALLTVALQESLAGFTERPQTAAVCVAGGVSLSGRKVAVPLADRAQRILVNATLEDGIALFLLDPAAHGVVLETQVSTTREPWFALSMQDVLVPASDCLLSEMGSVRVIEQLVAAYCILQAGVVDAMLEMTARYTCTREQFGVPVGSFQAVQHRAADGFIDRLCLQQTAWQAASLLAAGKEATTELLIAKVWAGDAGHRMSYAAQHLHGGAGIDRAYPLWRYCLWARQLEMVFGPSTAQLAVLGRQIAEGSAFAQ